MMFCVIQLQKKSCCYLLSMLFQHNDRYPNIELSNAVSVSSVALCILFYIAGKNAFVIYAAVGANSKGKQKKLERATKKVLLK